jgi:hypothetical protein
MQFCYPFAINADAKVAKMPQITKKHSRFV